MAGRGMYSETIQFGSAAAATGFTHSVNCTTLSIAKVTSDYIFTNAIAGYSVLQAQAGGGAPRWGIGINARLGGIEQQVAGVTGIGGLSRGLIPFEVSLGTTLQQFIGAPRPSSLSIIGLSTGVGTSFGVVVTLTYGN